jgi:two-component system, NarL family, invasion response regulator UvrY
MRILLIEDHPIVRAACRSMLQANAEVEVREAATAADGVRLSREFGPDIIILDLRLPDGNGTTLLETLRADAPERKIIVFSMYDDPAFAGRALEAGARGYITKNDDPDVLLQAIECVGRGNVFLTASMAERLALINAGGGTDPVQNLSAREREVLGFLGEGKTLIEIADQLNVSYRTSASITAQIKAKLNIASTAALIKWAADHQRLRSGIA